MSAQTAAEQARGSVEHLDPEGLHANPAYTNVVAVSQVRLRGRGSPPMGPMRREGVPGATSP